MMRLTKFAGLAGLFAVLSATAAARAGQPDAALPEIQPAIVELDGNASALTYWVSEPDGWHVVTTVDTVIGRGSATEQHAVVRFSAVLQPGQSQLISVPSFGGEQQQAVRIERIDDRIEVSKVAGAV
jgi:hypothetical protein